MSRESHIERQLFEFWTTLKVLLVKDFYCYLKTTWDYKHIVILTRVVVKLRDRLFQGYASSYEIKLFLGSLKSKPICLDPKFPHTQSRY